ncbi:MAG: prephenate dehydrogenase [Candidatus Omnitrophica bacterium]|nr:prephenate dehydrogenase [Candidatus Omnitrophota bacterium]
MVFQRHLFRKVTILGTGLLGGSIGLALKKNGLAEKVVGMSRHEASARAAVAMGAIDIAETDLQKAIAGADLVILAAPVKVILENIRDIARHLRRDCIVTDVGSTKSFVVDAAQKHFPAHVLFVGSHPMAGSEKSGVAHASADLFKGASVIMTPTAKTNKLAKDKVKHLWTKLGAEVRIMDPVKHDEVMAFVSHLPHLAAFAMMRAIPDEFLPYGSTGLKDTTRVAASSSKMWGDICLSNYRNVLKSIDEMAKSLADLRKAILEHDEEALAEYLNQAKGRRESLDKK